jgi:hypothetical protein
MSFLSARPGFCWCYSWEYYCPEDFVFKVSVIYWYASMHHSPRLARYVSIQMGGTICKRFTFMLPWIVIVFFLNSQPDALIIPILFCYKTLHVLGIFCAHHQEFSTVHSALLSFMQIFYDRFQAESGWDIRNLHKPHQCRMYSRKLLMMGREDAQNM